MLKRCYNIRSLHLKKLLRGGIQMKNHQTQEERHEMLVNGPIETVIPKLAIPTIISMMVSSIYNTADTFFVSQIGTSASGAVGVIFSAMAIIQALSFMIGMGSGNYMARTFGAGNQELGEKIASTGFFTGLILGTLIAIIGVSNIEEIVMLLGSTETIKPYAVDYAQYIFLATPFMMCSFIMNNLLRLQGLAMYAMVGITTGGILNIFLDPLFIFTFDLGTAGAAIATGVSQFVSFCILLAQCNLRKDCVTIRLRNFLPKPSIYKNIIFGGLPSLGRQGMASLSSIVLNVTARPYGDAAIAAMAIVSKCTILLNSVMVGFGQGFQPVCAFSYGAHKYSRVKKSFWFCVKVSTIFLLVLSATIFLFSSHVIELFRKDDAAVIAIGTLALRLQICTVPLNGFFTMSNMCTQSVGYGIRATILSMSRQGIFLIPILIIASQAWGLLGIQAAQPISDICTFFLSIMIMRGVLKDLDRQDFQENPARQN